MPSRPYLTREETNERLKALGFEIHGPDCLRCGYPPQHIEGNLVDTAVGRKMFTAILELLSGAIAEWAQVELSDDTRIDQVNQELLEWTEEYLVG